MKRSGLFYLSAVAVAVLLSPACTDEGEDDVGTGGSSVTGLTTTGSTAGPTTSTTGASTGSGGEGGGGGGPSVDCLPASATAAYFTIADASLCAVATYTAPGLILDGYTAVPTWGAHGGPLTGQGAASTLTISRWSVPADGAELTVSDANADATVVKGAFWGPQLVDIAPGVTIGSWTAPFPSEEGGFVRVEGTDVVQADASGVFSLATSQGRLFFTGLSAAGSTGSTNALYAALVTSTSFTADGIVDTWGAASGVLAVDALGNLFASMTDFGAGTQEIRGFAAADVAPGDPSVTGVTLGTLPGYGTSIAAIVPDGTSPGLVLFQPTETAALDVVGFPYTVEGGPVVDAGDPAPVLTLTEAGTALSLMTDDQGRVWVGALQTDSTTDSVFFVLDRAPR